MRVDLTRSDMALLRELVRRDARRVGYGTMYHGDDGQSGGPQEWPPRLKALRRVIRKLMDTSDVLHG